MLRPIYVLEGALPNNLDSMLISSTLPATKGRVIQRYLDVSGSRLWMATGTVWIGCTAARVGCYISR